MNNKMLTKIFLDVVMTVLYLILMFDFGTGTFFHEIAGIFIGLLFILHVILNFKTVSAMLKAFKLRKLPAKQVFLLILDMILPFSMLIVIITGIIISNELFKFGISSYRYVLFTVHNITSYICLAILGIHILFHASYLLNAVKKTFSHRHDYTVKKEFAKFVASCLTVCIVYITIFIYHNSDEKIIEKTNAESNLSTQITTSDEPLKPFSSQNSDNGNSYFEQNNNNSSETESYASQNVSESQEIPSLNEYLGSLHCNGCGKHCLLTNPRCGRGRQQAQMAQTEYYDKYQISQ